MSSERIVHSEWVYWKAWPNGDICIRRMVITHGEKSATYEWEYVTVPKEAFHE